MINYHVDSAGRYYVKVCGYVIDRFNKKKGIREPVKFRSRAAAEKAAKYRLEVNRAFASLSASHAEDGQ